MIRRVIYIAMLLVTLIATAGCSTSPPQEEAATPTPIPTPIVPTKPTYTVQRGEVVKKLQFTGRIAPVVEEELFFRTSGYVGVVLVERNDAVQADDILAELETTDLQNQLAQARAELKSIRLNSEQRIAEAKTNLQIAELRLEQARTRIPDLTAAEIALEQAIRAEADAAYEYEKAQNRPWEWKYEHVQEAYTEAWQNAKDNLAIAQANYDSAVDEQYARKLEVTILETEVENARRQLEQIEAGLDIETAELTVKRLEAQLSDARVVAPFDGVVLSLNLVEGRLVDAYRPVAIIADPDKLEVSADLLDRQLRELSEGMPVTAVLFNRPGEEIKGSIRVLPYPYGGGGRTQGVEGETEEDKSTRVTLEATPEEAGYERGDMVRVTVVLERKDDVLWLPPQAIRTFEGRKFVVVQEGEAQQRVDVKIGIEGEDRVEIEEGLTEGQTIIGQ